MIQRMVQEKNSLIFELYYINYKSLYELLSYKIHENILG